MSRLDLSALLVFKGKLAEYREEKKLVGISKVNAERNDYQLEIGEAIPVPGSARGRQHSLPLRLLRKEGLGLPTSYHASDFVSEKSSRRTTPTLIDPESSVAAKSLVMSSVTFDAKSDITTALKVPRDRVNTHAGDSKSKPRSNSPIASSSRVVSSPPKEREVVVVPTSMPTRIREHNSLRRVPSQNANKGKMILRRDTRAMAEILPLGPQHLEYDYDLAYKNFKATVYEGLGKLGYIPPRGVDRSRRLEKCKSKELIESIAPIQLAEGIEEKLYAIPSVSHASTRLNAADSALEEALGRGETWDNTPVPPEFRWGHPSLTAVEYMRFRHDEWTDSSLEVSNRDKTCSSKSAGKQTSPLVEKNIEGFDETSTDSTLVIDDAEIKMSKRRTLSGTPDPDPTGKQTLTIRIPPQKKRKVEEVLEEKESQEFNRPKRIRRAPRRFE